MFLAKILFAVSGLATFAVALDDLKNCYCGYPTQVGKTSDPSAIEAVCNSYGELKKDHGGFTACGILIDINEPMFFNACRAQAARLTENWCE